MEPVGIFMGICIDLLKKRKQKLNIMQRFCNKKGTFRVFTGFGHLQTSETSGRNMTVELDSRHPLLPKTGWGKTKILLILRGGNGKF
jgi:hypothetical protein